MQPKFLLLTALLSSPAVAAPLDTLSFGDAVSEKAHQVAVKNSEIVKGTLVEPARRLLPNGNNEWQGGTVNFSIKVDPTRPNYLTVKFSGDEVNVNRLTLAIEGKQVGYRHLGDVEQLDFGTEEPAYKGRFYYTTTPLPITATQGKQVINCEIRSSGRIWGYGRTFEQYQKPVLVPSRGIYKVFTHTDGFFAPPADNKQGIAPAATVRISPGAEVQGQLKARVNTDVKNILAGKNPPNQMQAQFLAKAFFVKWTPAHQNPHVAQRVIETLDALVVAHRKNPKLVEAGPASWNPEWYGFGPAGHALALLQEKIQPRLDEKIGDIPRRAAYAELLRASVDWLRTHRRQYTNQSMIVDLNIYASNRGLRVVAPEKALPETKALGFLYESIGLTPWLGSDTDTGPAKPLGANYFQLTAKGLTRELGYVGTYGEVLDWVGQIYDVTRPAPGAEGDAKIKAQLAKIAIARAAFRHPALDAEGNRVMRLEQIVGWRDAHYPGVVTYGQRAARDAGAMQSAALSLDPILIGYAQQMFADNQFFASVEEVMKEKGFRITAGLLETPDEYEIVRAQKPVATRLPMTPGQPDFVFSDEEDGVLAVKNGSDILYVSLYWRARFAINNLARVHFTTPTCDRIAVVRQETQFTPSGMTYKRGTGTNAPWGPWLPRYPNEDSSAHSGEELPIAKIPDGINFSPGKENIHAGKGDFYTLRYGSYLIGMNCTTDKTFDLPVPQAGRELVSKSNVAAGEVKKVGPRSTVVCYLGD